MSSWEDEVYQFTNKVGPAPFLTSQPQQFIQTSGPVYVQGGGYYAQGVPRMPVPPKKETAVDWLRGEVNEVCELARSPLD